MLISQSETRNPQPLPLLLPDPRYPSTHVRSWYQGELQTERDLYLAEMIGMENLNSKTTRLSITVVHASDGSTLSYNKLICKMRLRKDGNRYHRITIPNVGGCETVSEAIQLVLADAARRRETRMVSLTNPMFEPAVVPLHAGPR